MKKREERRVSDRALKTLSARLYRADKRRNMTAAAAVAMSAMLVVVVLSTILTVSELMKRQKQMMLGTQAEGIYFGVSYYWYESLRDSGHFDDVRLADQMGTWETEASASDANNIYYADKETAGWNFNELEKGSWPDGMNEIAVDRNFVEANGGNIRVGSHMQITLKTPVAETKKEVVITGICAANNALGENRIFVSEEFFMAERCFIYMNVYCRFEPGKYTDKNLEGFLLDIQPDAVVNAVANPNAGNRPGAGTLAIVLGLLALASVCAGLMVYTIYYISAVKNAARYGQLKLLGVTEGQIKKIVLRHALHQYVTGLPAGCIFGVVFAYVLMPVVASFAGLKDAVPVLRPQYLLCAAFVSLVVVLLGAKKPMRILAKVPPAHAAVLTDGYKRKKETKSVRFTAGSFARKNIRRRAKKTALVAASAAVVMVIFICTMNVVNSLNVDALMQNFNQFADITVASEDVLVLNVDSRIRMLLDNKSNQLPDGLEGRLAEVSGGMEMVCHYSLSMAAFLYGEEAEKFCGIVLGEDYRKEAEEDDFGVRRALEYQNGEESSVMVQYDAHFYEYGQVEGFEVYEGSIDREKFESGKYVLAVAQDKEGESLYHTGDVISLYSEYPEDAEAVEHLKPDDNGRHPYFDSLPRKDYEVLAVVGDSYRRQMCSGDAHMGVSLGLVFPTQTMEEMPKKPGLFMVTMDVPDGEYQSNADTLERVEPLVAECLKKEGGEDISYRSRSMYKKQLEQFGMTLALIGNGLAVLIGAMFIVSFLNSCVSGIAERKEEFATLQAIGMTRKHLITVLRWENLYTVLIAAVPGYIIGQLVSYAAITALSKQLNYLVWTPSILPGILLAVTMCLLAMAYPNRRTDIGTVLHL